MWLCFVALLLAAFCVTAVHAATLHFNLKTYITVDKPVQVPGAVLQPNVKYLFRRIGPQSGFNHTIVVMTADEKHVMATFNAISDQHVNAPGRTVITFYETDPGFAKPIREWIYPDRNTGLQFLYPKQQMAEITAHLMERNSVETQTAEAQPAPPQNSEEASQAATASAPAEVQSSPAEVEREKPSAVTPDNSMTNDENVSSEPEVQTAQNTPAPTELPKTAGELPLLLLAGLAAIGLRKALRS